MSITKDGSFPVSARITTQVVNSQTFPAFTTPGTNRMVVAIFMGNGPTAVSANTFTSPNLTWTKRATALGTGTNNIAEIFTAWAPSVVTGEVATITWTGSNAYDRSSYVIFSLAGSSSSGVGATAASPAGATDGDPSLAIVATAAGSYLLGGLVYRSSGSDTAPDGNTTSEYNAGGGGGFGFNERVGSRISSGASSHTIGFTGDDAFGAWQMAAIEILEAVVASDLNALIGEPITGSSVLN